MVQIEGRNLYERVVEEVKTYITEQNLKPGDRLPTEHELAEMLGVSRSTVREAMKSLVMMGLVSTKPGTGCVVRPFNVKALARHMSFGFELEDTDLHQLLEARLMLETAVLPAVVRRVTDQQLGKMEESLRLLRLDIEQGRDGVAADVMFHEALFEAVGNKILQGFADVMKEFFTRLRKPLLDSKQLAVATLEEHARIYEAIRAGDWERACEILRKHLDWYLTTDRLTEEGPAL